MHKIKIRLLFFLFLFASIGWAQDTISRSGKIKISKPGDSIHVIASFKMEGSIESNTPSSIQIMNFRFQRKKRQRDQGMVENPLPEVKGYKSPFDYSEFFQKNIDFEKIVLEYDTDTVRIKIDIHPDGNAVYRNLSSMKRIGSRLVVFDPNRKVYYSASTHNLVMDCLKKIRRWHPAYTTEIERRRFKGAVVMKPSRKNIYASGTLTIVFFSEALKK